MKMKYLYLILCIFGIILPYSQLIPYMLENTFDIASFIDQLFVNRVSALIALDLFVTALTYIIFAVSEGISLKIKHLWIPILGTFLVGASLGFPLFLYLREINLESKIYIKKEKDFE